jgi:hypothetical protein
MAKKMKLGQAEKSRQPISGQKEVIIDIEPDGTVIVEGYGMTNECHEITGQLEAALGSVEYSEDKDDFGKKQPIVKKKKTGVTM